MAGLTNRWRLLCLLIGTKARRPRWVRIAKVEVADDSTEASRITTSCYRACHLKPGWSVDLDLPRANAEPIEVDGVVYLPTGLSIFQAYHSRSWKSVQRN
jgi:hypothetical protein